MEGVVCRKRKGRNEGSWTHRLGGRRLGWRGNGNVQRKRNFEEKSE